MPVSFWLLIYICSSPSLEEIRTEIHETGTTIDDRLDTTVLNQCRLLEATYHEVLWIVGSGVTTNRIALEDTVVTMARRDYTLKKGGVV